MTSARSCTAPAPLTPLASLFVASEGRWTGASSSGAASGCAAGCGRGRSPRMPARSLAVASSPSPPVFARCRSFSFVSDRSFATPFRVRLSAKDGRGLFTACVCWRGCSRWTCASRSSVFGGSGVCGCGCGGALDTSTSSSRGAACAASCGICCCGTNPEHGLLHGRAPAQRCRRENGRVDQRSFGAPLRQNKAGCATRAPAGSGNNSRLTYPFSPCSRHFHRRHAPRHLWFSPDVPLCSCINYFFD